MLGRASPPKLVARIPCCPLCLLQQECYSDSKPGVHHGAPQSRAGTGGFRAVDGKGRRERSNPKHKSSSLF